MSIPNSQNTDAERRLAKNRRNQMRRDAAREVIIERRAEESERRDFGNQRRHTH